MEKIASGVVHTIPKDLRAVLMRTPRLRELWNGLTPLARNEWICYVTFVKKAETREKHLSRLESDLTEGKRRPCCWPGCPHRRPQALKWFQGKTRSKS
jgi:uncharacterized protein YdeI (YjbR/CyaY-like superfamily)